MSLAVAANIYANLHLCKHRLFKESESDASEPFHFPTETFSFLKQKISGTLYLAFPLMFK